MIEHVDAVFFDMGGTLRYRTQDPQARREALAELKRRLPYEGEPQELHRILAERANAYKIWSQETLCETPEEELWSRWMWPDGDRDRIAAMGVELEHLWRATQGKRIVRDESLAVIEALHRRGYRLGVISNTTSREAVPQALVEYGLVDYFPVVVLSSSSGHRKPGTRIFEIATEALGVEPGRSVYVGDRPSRDVLGSKAAGFALSVLIYDDLVEVKEPIDAYPPADYVIDSLTELLDIL
jgi:HAD superfamily hydrolase (TIGR01549 family)